MKKMLLLVLCLFGLVGCGTRKDTNVQSKDWTEVEVRCLAEDVASMKQDEEEPRFVLVVETKNYDSKEEARAETIEKELWSKYEYVIVSGDTVWCANNNGDSKDYVIVYK